MSWNRNFIGDVKHVIAQGEAAVKQALGYADNRVNIAVAKLETELSHALGEGFEAAGKKLDEAGNALTALGLHIESSGHFGADGSGNCTIKITSIIGAAAVPAPASEPAPESPADAPAQ